MCVYLQHTTHPLEAVLLRGIWSLFCHHNNAFIMQHRYRENCNPDTEQRCSLQSEIDSYSSQVKSKLHLSYLPLYTNFMGSTASAVATTSSALCLRPLTTISPSIFPTTNTRLSCNTRNKPNPKKMNATYWFKRHLNVILLQKEWYVLRNLNPPAR